MPVPDIVYVVRPGDRNEELRHSLRSLQNVPHGEVFLAGHSPEWVQGTTHIQVKGYWDKYRSSTLNLEAACRSPYPSDPFWLMNDDFFVMKRMDAFPIFHRGPVTDVIPYYVDTYPNSPYLRGMQKTLELMGEAGFKYPLSYELHIPLLIHKAGMLEAISRGKNIRAFHKRTYYGNLQKLGGTYSDDVKVREGMLRDYRTWDLLSTSDAIFDTHAVGAYIRETFPDPCPYERKLLIREKRTVGPWSRAQSKQVIRYTDG
jgi:hypothetical protein